MSNPSMTFGHYGRGLHAPRGSVWAANAMAALIQGIRKLDDWLLNARQQEPQTAEEVLAWARRIESREPGFAADLRAAAHRSLGRDE